MEATIRVVIADDHALVREGTRRILDAARDIEVVGEAGDGEEAVRRVCDLHPDVAIVDIGMPSLNGLEATERIKRDCPDVAVLILTVHDDDEYVFALLEAGAAGYLLKDVIGDELVQAVRDVQSGEPVLHRVVATKLLARVQRERSGQARAEPLSPRELEVLRLAAAGMSNKEIASRVAVSCRTVQAHFAHIFTKLGVASRTEAVVRCLQRGWIQLDDLVERR